MRPRASTSYPASFLMFGIALVSGTVLFSVAPAQAACSFAPTAGNDSFICDSGTWTGSLIDPDGDDTLTFPVGGTGHITGDVSFLGTGADRIEMGSGAVDGAVDQGDGNDSFVISGGTVSGNVQQGLGRDDFTMSGGQIGSLNQGTDHDIFHMSGGWITGYFDDGDEAYMTGGRIGRVNMLLEDNLFDMSGGRIDGNLVTGFFNDTIIVSGGTIGGNVSVSGGTDSVTVTGGTVGGEVRMSVGADTFVWDGGGVIHGLIDLGGDDDTASLSNLTNANIGTTPRITGGAGTDTLTFENVQTDQAARFDSWETIALTDNSQLTVDGILTLGDSGTGTGFLTIDSTSTMYGGSANGEIAAFDSGQPVSVINSGRIDLTNGGNSTSDTFTIHGNYTGNNGVLLINTSLGDDASPTDQLRVDGDTSGTTGLVVNNVGGAGASTTEGIPVIDVAGASNGTFALLGDYVVDGQQAVVGGAYAYRLYQGGVSDPTDGDWYLRSDLVPGDPDSGPLLQPGVGIYEALPQALLRLNDLPTLQQRVGTRYWNDENANAAPATGADGAKPSLFWGRVEASHSAFDPSSSTTGLDYESDEVEMQAGLDFKLHEGDAGLLIGALTVQYGLVSAEIGSIWGNGKIEAAGYGVGGTLTWYADNGFYVDGQMRLTVFDSDLSSDLAGTLADDDLGFGYAFGVETGRRIPVGGAWSLTPQAQLVFAGIDDDFTDAFGTPISLDDADRLTGRVGISADYNNQWQDASGRTSRATLYGIANLYYEFIDDTKVDVADLAFSTTIEQPYGGVGLGGTYSWADGRYAIFGEVSYKASFENGEDNFSYGGTGGFRAVW